MEVQGIQEQGQVGAVGWGWDCFPRPRNHGNSVTEREKTELTPYSLQTLSSQSLAWSLVSEARGWGMDM